MEYKRHKERGYLVPKTVVRGGGGFFFLFFIVFTSTLSPLSITAKQVY